MLSSTYTLQLDEFCFISYHLMLGSNVISCHLKHPVRQEAYDIICWCFPFKVATTWVWQNLVGSALFLMILCLILIYLHVIWRTQWDERPTTICSFAFQYFHFVVPQPVMQSSVSLLISHGLISDSNPFKCHFKGSVRHEYHSFIFQCFHFVVSHLFYLP